MAGLHKRFKPPWHLRRVLNKKRYQGQDGSTLTEALMALTLFGLISYLSIALIIQVVYKDRPELLLHSISAVTDQIERDMNRGRYPVLDQGVQSGYHIGLQKSFQNGLCHYSWTVILNRNTEPVYTFHLLLPDTYEPIYFAF